MILEELEQMCLETDPKRYRMFQLAVKNHPTQQELEDLKILAKGGVCSKPALWWAIVHADRDSMQAAKIMLEYSNCSYNLKKMEEDCHSDKCRKQMQIAWWLMKKPYKPQFCRS